jgi:photosystem II stability/assembly factor-like uncharacterized protein
VENNILIYINNWDNYYKRGEHYLLLSNDLGSNWSVIKKIENLAVHLVYVNPDDNKNICLVLDNTKYGNKVNTIDVVLSYDGGITWKTIYQYNLSKDDDTRDNKNIIQCIQFVKNENGNSIFIGGSKGLLRSNDEGNSWEIMGGIK